MTPIVPPGSWGSALVGLVSLPLGLVGALVAALHPALRGELRGRLGLDVAPVAPGAVWVHAASLGELRAAEGLLDSLDGPILLTADTDAGVARARAIAASRPAIVAGVRPIDHPFTLAPLWADARPRALVFIEGVFPPVLAAMARRAGVPVIRASARLGPRTRRFAAWAPALFRAWTAPTTRVFAKDAGEADVFRRFGAAPVEVGGDTKLVAALPPPALRWARTYVVGASTRPGDEAALLAAVDAFPEPARPGLLLAPRAPERFDAVAALLAGRRWVRRSAVTGVVSADVDVVLLDSIGELSGMLAGSRAVFVGGTFDRALGGHSPAEAVVARAPVIAGPHRQANAAAWRLASVHDAETPEALHDALARAFAATPPVPDLVRVDLPRAGAQAGVGADPRVVWELRRATTHPAAPEACPRPWLAPVAVAVALGEPVRRAWRARAPTRVDVPVVSVESVNARGPGRTSIARWAAAALGAEGRCVGVVVRGYRRPGGGRDVRVGAAFGDVGDEGALIARDGWLVAAGPDRGAAARLLVARGCDAIVVDDGGPDLHADVRIEVVDARFPSGRGVLPAGERRRRERGEGRVILQHGRSTDGPWARRHWGPWRRGEGVEAPAGPVAMFAGLGRSADARHAADVPIGRFCDVGDHGEIDAVAVAALRRWAGALPLATTAKDLVRLPASFADEVYWRDVTVEVEGWDPAWWAFSR